MDPAHFDPTELLCEMADILEKVCLKNSPPFLMFDSNFSKCTTFSNLYVPSITFICQNSILLFIFKMQNR
jgi:hypothetical protein